MTCADMEQALCLPASSTVDRRVPKRLLLENGAPTATDRRALEDGIEEVVWTAALKPGSIGVPPYRDESREYLEIDLLRAKLRTGAKERRLIELIHRAIPYPLILFSEGSGLALSFAHKRWALNEANTVVLDGEVEIAYWNDAEDSRVLESFREAFRLDRLPSHSLFAMYDGLIAVIYALEAARITGAFTLPPPERAAARRTALTDYYALSAQAQRVRNDAGREKQTARLVELNLQLKKLEAEMSDVRTRLS